MRILHVITRLILGGAQQNTIACCAAQVEAGHEVHLAFGPIYGPEGSLFDEAERSGATLHEIPALRRSVLPIHDLLACRQIGRLIDRVQPDLVHTHSSKAGILGRAAAWKRNVPAVVHTIHGLPFHGRQNPLIRSIYLRAERYAAKRCHHLIGITEAMCDAFVEQGIASREKMSVIPSGVDLARFTRDIEEGMAMRPRLGIPPDATAIALVARLDPLKGHADLLEAWPAIAERFPKAWLVFVGDGWDRSRIERLAGASNHGDRIVITGLIPRPRMPAMYSAIDVCVLPSYQEGQSRVLVEAVACGCAIVGYDVGGIGEVCVDGETGRLVPRGDTNALQRAIVDLLDDDAERRRLVEQGRGHVHERFDQRIMTASLERLYRRLCGSEDPSCDPH